MDMTVPYRHVERLGKTTGSCLYRAQRCEDGLSVLLKRLEPELAVAVPALRFRREYDILQSLDIPGVIHPVALTDESGEPMMILEDPGGESLEAS